MPTPLLATKLYIPPPRPNAVLRPRLIARLNQGLQRKLTLIAAPAGFGKTTLVSAWIASLSSEFSVLSSQFAHAHPSQNAKRKTQNFKTAWLSLDAADGDPIRFLTYLVAALQTIAPNIGVGVLEVLQSPQPPPPEAILTALLNDIATLPVHGVLVLDDYHLIDAAPVDAALTFLLEHIPPQLHLVITTREDPQLPLARFRVRSHLTELRAADLRFTAAEAAAFLSQVMGFNLSTEDISALEARTEGWIAGLQLAALSMQGHQDIPGFIQAFAGDNRYIVDYLVDEVLQRQPEEIRSFLLQTAILDRLSGSLCDAVVDAGRQTNASSLSVVRRPSSVVLEALERGNFFVVPLDDTRQWYRYHHLFAEVLQAHLRAEQPDRLPTLHRRASAWYEQHGATADAIRHALAAEDFARVATLVELAVPVMRQSRQESAVLGWLQALPDHVVQDRPVLSVYYAGTLLQSGELTGVETRLRDAERWLDALSTPTSARDTMAGLGEQPHPSQMQVPPGRRSHPPEMVVIDEEAFLHLPSLIAVFRAGQALAIGDLPQTVHYARRALDLIPEDDHHLRGAATAILGLAAWTSGDLEAAYQSYADGMAHLQSAGHISDAIGGVIALADIRIAQGRLHEAMRVYERGLQLATAQHPAGTWPVLRGTADMYVGMSEIQREYDDLPAATQHLLDSQALGEHTGFPQNPYRWRVAMARIRQSQGDLAGALALLDEAERLYVSDFFPNVRPVAALKTRVWVAQGRLGDALDWVREQGLSAEDDLSYLREFAHITLARVLLATYQSDQTDRSLQEVRGLLGRLLHAAEAGERTGSVIDILVLLALAHQMQGDIPAALVPLGRALKLAEPEGYVRLFVDEGPPMKLQLAACRLQIVRSAHGESNRHTDKLLAYIDMLLAAFPGNGAQAGKERATKNQSSIVEPLSERELAVLRLFKTELSGPEIAQELVIALSTVRTHTKSIYSKLNVNSRRAAVKRAAELDLI